MDSGGCEDDCRCKSVGRLPLANGKTTLEYPKWRRTNKNKVDEEFQYQLVLKQLENCKIEKTYIGKEDTNDKNKWVCQAPDCCNKQKFFSLIQLRNHLYKKFGICRNENFQPDQTTYNMGCGEIAHTPDEAMDKFLEREFEDVKNCSKTPHQFKCIPDSYNYGPIATKIAIDQTEGKPCRSGDDASIAGKKVEEKLVNKLRNAFEELDVKNTVLISEFQEKPQGKNNQQIEIDILIIFKDTKTIIQIESKKCFDTKTKAFEQLNNGYNYFNSKIPFLAEHGWQYVKVAYFENGWKPEENCEGCHPYVLTQNTDILEWLKTITIDEKNEGTNSRKKQKSLNRRRKISSSTKRSKASTTISKYNSTDPTYIFVLKLIFYQMYQHEDCITQSDLLQLTDRNIEEISLPERVIFFNKVQWNLLNTKEGCKRVVFISQFGTGKTTILKAKAKELLEDGQKVAFVVFKDIELKEESLLFQNYKQEFKEFKDVALFTEIPNAGSTVNEKLKQHVRENVGFHFIMDEVPVMPEGLTSTTVIEVSKTILPQKSYLWFACQSENAPSEILLNEHFYCPDMPHALRYSANILKITKAIKEEKGGTSFPSQQTNPEVYFNRGPRALFFTLKTGTNLACAVEQLVYILQHEKAKTLIKIDFEQKNILKEFKRSQISNRLIDCEDPNVSQKDIMKDLTDDKILVVTSRDNGFIRGFEFSILVHITQSIDGDQVELIYSRCKSKLIIVCKEDLPKQIVPNNVSCDFAKIIPVHDELMPQTVESAIKDQNLDHVLSYYLNDKRPLPIDATNKASQTGLMLACASRSHKAVETFLNRKANLDAIDAEGWTPIHHASKNGCLDIVKKVDEATRHKFNQENYKLSLTTKTNEGETALHIAAEEGHVEVVQHLVGTKFFDVNGRTNSGYTPLHIASFYGHSDIVKCLVNECKADVNLENKYGDTPLHDASIEGHSDVVRCLVNECKADVNLKDDKYGDTPLHLASVLGHSDVVRCLVNEGKADVNLKNNDGDTPLHDASFHGHSDVVRCLVNEGKAEVNFKNEYGSTPLHHASSRGHSDVVRCLVNEGKADVNLKNYNGETPLHLASEEGHSDVVRCLVNEGKADVNLKDKNGDTPLHLASSRGHSDVVRCLVNEGKADVNLKDNFGRKPIDYVFNYEIRSFLESKSQLD